MARAHEDSLALSDTWELTDSGLHNNVLAISLQGLANRQQASLYLEYPSDWAYGYTASVREWVVTSRQSNYTALASVADVGMLLTAAGFALPTIDTEVSTDPLPASPSPSPSHSSRALPPKHGR